MTSVEPGGGRVGRYELLRLIGAGGMGEVYEAVLHGPSGFRKRVAVKRVRGRTDDRALAREARIGALMSHPNVVSTWELSETDEGWLVAMELVDGPPLSTLRRAGPLSAAAIVDIGAQVAAGLAHIHELTVEGRPMQVVHRDVKPSNVLVDPSGLVKLVDLGIAALESGDAGAAGTPGFVAPEQIDGQAEPRSDLFSLGAVLLWLCTGLRPFGQGAAALVAVRRAEAHLAHTGALAAAEAQVPGLGAVVERCLRSRVADRWPSARALGDALRALRVDLPPGPSLAELVAARHLVRVPEIGSPTVTATTWSTSVTGVPASTEAPSSPLIGRAGELAALRGALTAPGVRVIGVRGPAGVGKTRLLGALAEAVPERWCVDLSQVTTVPGLYAAVGGALETPLHGDALRQLGVVLAGHGPGVLLLDAADGVVDALPPILHAWTAAAPAARVVVAARGRLAADVEVVVAPLTDDEALLLLRDRAPDAVREASPAELSALVAALDGLPLAIELAAARAEYVPLGRLVDGFRGAERNPLRAAFATSWDGLASAERAVLAQLAVFAGGFELAAAEAVVDAPGARTIDVLHRLVDRSLVQAAPSGRLRLLAPIVALVAERLPAEERTRAERRHAEWYARLAVLADPVRDGPDYGNEIQILTAERENLQAALQRTLAAGEAELAGACAVAMLAPSYRSGPLPEALRLCDEVVAALPPRDGARPYEVRLLTAAGTIAGTLGDRDTAAERLGRALALAERAGDRAGEIAAEIQFGNLLRETGDPMGAEVWLQRAIAGAERLGHRRLLARAIGDVAPVYRLRGDLDSAERHLLRSIALHREVRNRRAEATALNNLANVRSQRGIADESREMYLEAARVAGETGDTALAATVYLNLGVDESRYGRRGAAVSYLRRSIALLRRLGAVPMQIVALGNLGWALVDQGEHDAARAVLEEAIGLSDTFALPWLGTVALGNLAHLELLEGRADLAWDAVQRALQAEIDVGDERAAMRLRLVASWVLRARLGAEGPRQALAEIEAAVAWARAHDDAALLAEARLERGIVLMLLGDRERAEADLAAPSVASQVPPSDVLRAKAALVWLRASRGAPREACRAELDQLRLESDAFGLRPGAPLLRWLDEVARLVEST